MKTSLDLFPDVMTLAKRLSFQIAIIGALLLHNACGTLGVVVADGGGRPQPGPSPRTYPSYRSLNIPPGHLPPPGECRIWYPGKPPGQQPPPVSCAQATKDFRVGAWIITRTDAKTLEVKEKKNNAVEVKHYLVD